MLVQLVRLPVESRGVRVQYTQPVPGQLDAGRVRCRVRTSISSISVGNATDTTGTKWNVCVYSVHSRPCAMSCAESRSEMLARHAYGCIKFYTE
eukprot:SAG31_NODE_2330_length_5933_cov_5.706891_2_plen_94_part_00